MAALAKVCSSDGTTWQGRYRKAAAFRNGPKPSHTDRIMVLSDLHVDQHDNMESLKQISSTEYLSTALLVAGKTMLFPSSSLPTHQRSVHVGLYGHLHFTTHEEEQSLLLGSLQLASQLAHIKVFEQSQTRLHQARSLFSQYGTHTSS